MISSKKLHPEKPVSIQVNKVIIKTKQGHFSQPRKHLNYVEAGQVLATYEDGEEVIAQRNEYILLPNEKAKICEERLYL